MLYQQTLDYLFSQLPMFHRIGPAAYKADLNNTLALATHLSNPHLHFKSIHVAGTNGKGSVAHMLASIFQQAGYKTGLCTSPHLKDFRERFKINGVMMHKEFVVDFVERHKDFFDTIKPSFFEMTIAMTFDYFASEKVDIAIIETGLGGRLDSTNIITPELSVITNIGFDHMSLLGNTIEAIATEKAGIIKKGVPVVIGKCREQAGSVFINKAREMNTAIYFADEFYHIQNPQRIIYDHQALLKLDLIGNEKVRDVECSLTGTYQYENLCTVAASIDIMRKGGFIISEDDFLAGIRNVVSNTGILGRWQTLQTNPLVICDTGHNADGIKYVTDNIATINYSHLHFVLGIMNDKDLNEILGLLPSYNSTYYFCKPDVPRGMDRIALKNSAGVRGLVGEDYPTVADALCAAKKAAGKDDLVFVGGSTFVVAEVV